MILVRALADEFTAQFALHTSETATEAASLKGKTGFTTLRLLNKHGFLGIIVVLFHAVPLEGEEISLLAANGIGVVHCP